MSQRHPLSATALWLEAAGKPALRDETLPPVGPDDVLVRTLATGISRGTESLVFHGKVPVSEYSRMAGPNMGGQFPFPVKYGYQAVGEVLVGPDALVGKRVFVLHPHQSAFVVKAASVVPIPDTVSTERACLGGNMETALNALWDAGAGPCDRIAVVGGGVVGALIAYLAGRLPGARVTLIDIDESRAALARTLGVGFATPADLADAPERHGVGHHDIVFHTSASSAGLATCINLAGFEATIIEVSWYGETAVTAPLGGTFHARRLRLITSQVGEVATSRRSRYNHRARSELALGLLADPRLDALLAPSVSLSDLPKQLGDILAPRSGVLCQVVAYHD
jgi:threonine dehydrogenase-like Zn-dependent dehydrogenase